MKTKIRHLHTVLVESYYWITPAEAHPLPIRSEWVQQNNRCYTSIAELQVHSKIQYIQRKLYLNNIGLSIQLLGEESIETSVKREAEKYVLLLFIQYWQLNSKALIKN